MFRPDEFAQRGEANFNIGICFQPDTYIKPSAALRDHLLDHRPDSLSDNLSFGDATLNPPADFLCQQLSSLKSLTRRQVAGRIMVSQSFFESPGCVPEEVLGGFLDNLHDSSPDIADDRASDKFDAKPPAAKVTGRAAASATDLPAEIPPHLTAGVLAAEPTKLPYAVYGILTIPGSARCEPSGGAPRALRGPLIAGGLGVLLQGQEEQRGSLRSPTYGRERDAL